MIDLYFWTTDNGYKPRILLEETGLPYEIKPIDLTKKEQHSEAYLKINPGHKIPTIVDHDGPGGKPLTITESGAILKYIAEKAGSPLYPTDPAKRALVDQWFFYGSATFTPLAQQLGFFVIRSPEDVPAAKTHFTALVTDGFRVFDKRLAEAEYLAGEYSIADLAAYPDVHLHSSYKLSLDQFPNLRRWHDAIEARPATQRAWAAL